VGCPRGTWVQSLYGDKRTPVVESRRFSSVSVCFDFDMSVPGHQRSSGGIRARSAHPRTTDMQRLLQHVGLTKLVEQLTLVTLLTAHHGSTSSRFASTQRNHASNSVSIDFCNKIGQKATYVLQQFYRPQSLWASHRTRRYPEIICVQETTACRSGSDSWPRRAQSIFTHHRGRLRNRTFESLSGHQVFGDG
jgi:hypothetical protein